ncbi:MAG TPA: hypothetical protein VFQ30_04430, partial [Ktedonobacteraceae bacterium]|nr:hypothetical protein [Ktedonobacteraceae bacterium]
MSTAYSAPDPGCYRLVRGVRILQNENGALAICDYPLRGVRFQTTALRLLTLCTEQRTVAYLTQELRLPEKRVEALCEQLCRRG